jgi:glycosyltransferase involved in cell wall biosynthesis
VRILFVNDLTPDEGWGAEVLLARLARALEASGDTVELFAGEARHEGKRKPLDVWDPFARRRLRAFAERFRPDVVHHHNVLRELSVSVLGVPRGVATVLTVHDQRLLGVPEGAWSLFKSAKARLDLAVARRRVHVAIAVSEQIARGLIAAGFAHVHRVPAPAPPPDAAVSQPALRAPDILFAGRLTAEKGVHVLLEAFARTAASHRSARLIFAGEGPARSEIESAARRLGDGRVVLLGRVSEAEARALMRDAGIVVYPSVASEALGLTVLDAAVAGRPIVAADHSGLRELLGSGGGLLVPKGSVAELAAALDRVLDDADLAAKLGEAARQAVSGKHDPDAIAEATRASYRQALALTRRRFASRPSAR